MRRLEERIQEARKERLFTEEFSFVRNELVFHLRRLHYADALSKENEAYVVCPIDTLPDALKDNNVMRYERNDGDGISRFKLLDTVQEFVLSPNEYHQGEDVRRIIEKATRLFKIHTVIIYLDFEDPTSMGMMGITDETSNALYTLRKIIDYVTMHFNLPCLIMHNYNKLADDGTIYDAGIKKDE